MGTPGERRTTVGNHYRGYPEVRHVGGEPIGRPTWGTELGAHTGG